MHLIQLLLPLYRNDGQPVSKDNFARVRQELVDRFGGLTAYSRAPAKGRWKEEGEAVTHDEIVVYEVMAEALDRPWWAAYRRELEQRFGQEELVVRCQPVELL